MTPKTKKILWVVVPMGVAAIVFAVWYKLTNAPKKVVVGPSNPAATPARTAAPTPKGAAGVFPLQQGSRNSQVTQLQKALGVTADGIFGPVTGGSLQSQYGLSSIPDQKTLSVILNAAADGGASARAAAQALYNQYTAGLYDIKVQKTTFAEAVTEDANGVLSPTGSGFTMSAGEVYDNTVYTIDGVSVLGELILKVLSGTLQGEYTFDPTAVTLVPHGSYGLVPTTDPNTGLTTLPTF